MKFTATGDYLATRRVPPDDKDFAQIQSVIKKSDASITNLEMTISHLEGTPGMLNGGYSLFTTPDRLEDLKAYGFNLVALANNHTLDYSFDGLEKTLEYLREYGIIQAGAGMNRAEAIRPAYIDLHGKRVALISAVSTAYKAWTPGDQRNDMVGRPGPNMLSCAYDFRISREEFDVLKGIADRTHMNNMFNLAVHNGFYPPIPEGMMLFGFDPFGTPYVFRASDDFGASTYPDPKHQATIVRSIKDAKFAADYVIVNLHGHEFKEEDNAIPAAFHEIAARQWIDAGADAVVMQGAHATRGVEIYNGHPIFYGLGDFVFQQDTITAAPQDFYNAYAQSPTETLSQIFARLNENPNWLTNYKDAMTSVFAEWETEGGKLTGVTLYPIDLGWGKPVSQNGFPGFTEDGSILDRVIELSRAYGTEIVKESLTLDDGKTITVGKIYP